MFSKILTFGLFLSCSRGCPCSFNEELGEVSCDQGTQYVLPWLLPDCLSQDLYDKVLSTESRQGTKQTRTFDPTNESADCWSAAHSYNFIIRVK